LGQSNKLEGKRAGKEKKRESHCTTDGGCLLLDVRKKREQRGGMEETRGEKLDKSRFRASLVEEEAPTAPSSTLKGKEGGKPRGGRKGK